MRTNWISPCVSVLVSSLAPFFRHAGRGVVVRRPVVSRAVVVSLCLACPVPLVRVFLCGASVMSVCYSFRPIVVSLGSPFARQVGRGAGGCLCPRLYGFTQCYMPLIPVIYLAFLLYIGRSCYISGIFVIYLAFLLYAWRFCYISRILVISACFMLYYFVEVMRLWAGVFN